VIEVQKVVLTVHCVQHQETLETHTHATVAHLFLVAAVALVRSCCCVCVALIVYIYILIVVEDKRQHSKQQQKPYKDCCVTSRGIVCASHCAVVCIVVFVCVCQFAVC
jgi:ABC-type Fe3+ transport system permease subunit